MIIRSTNLAVPKPAGGRARRNTGIDKRPVGSVELFEPGPSHGDGPGVANDYVGDVEHHGGAQKAVYAYSREELDCWQRELGVELPDGCFGENLTTEGFDLESLLINQQVRIGDVLLEVSIPRSPCRTFAIHMGVPKWTKRFAERGRCGVYFRVVRAGVVRAGSSVEVLDAPDHDITMMVAFASAMGDNDAARRVVEANCLPPMYHNRLLERLGK